MYNPDRIMLANLRALFGVVIDIVLLRRGPEQLPASPTLLVIIMALFAVVAAVVSSQLVNVDPNWPQELAVALVMIPLWYRVALQLAKKRERFLQTVTAMFAVLLLFAPLAVPAIGTLMEQQQAYETTKIPPSGLLTLIVLSLVVWRFLIYVRITRAAFEWSVIPAVILVLAQEFAMLLVLIALTGASAPPT